MVRLPAELPRHVGPRHLRRAPEALSVRNGILENAFHPHVRREPTSSARRFPRLPGTSGGVSSTPSGRLYGRYAVRFRTDPVPGYKTAWLLWPDSGNWPRRRDRLPRGRPRQGASPATCTIRTPAPARRTGRVLPRRRRPRSGTPPSIEWAPGVAASSSTAGRGRSTSRVPARPMHWVLQTETHLERPALPRRRGHIQIDWVAVWRPA